MGPVTYLTEPKSKHLIQSNASTDRGIPKDINSSSLTIRCIINP